MSKTRMIFRKWPEEEGGDVIALMPDDHQGQYIGSYQHIGQHGSAHPDLIVDLEPASQTEIDELSIELEKIGYDVQVEA